MAHGRERIETGSSNEIRQYNVVDYAVLYNLTDIREQYIGDRLVNSIVDNPDLKEVYFCALPASGKTLVRDQLAQETERFGGGNIQIEFVSFDIIRSNLRRELGKQDPALSDPTNWTAVHWKKLSNNILSEINKEVPHLEGVRVVKFVEVVFFGGKDRGTTAIEHQAQQTKYSLQGRLQRMYIFVNPASEIFNLATEVREFVANSEPEGLVTQLKERFQFDPGDEFDDSFQSGAAVKQIFSRMAHAMHITNIRAEMRPDAYRWTKALKGRRYKQGEVVDDFEERLLYMEYVRRDVLNLDSDEGFVVINKPVAPGQKVKARLIRLQKSYDDSESQQIDKRATKTY